MTCRAFFLTAIFLTACAPAVPPRIATQDAPPASPLGGSYVLVPLPGEDDGLLGRVLSAPPQDGRSVEEVSRPNECADKLAPRKESPLAASFEDGQELEGGAKARAKLGPFGFDADAQTATHFYYKLEASRRVARLDTPEYLACCKAKGTCGYGFVSALVYGDGQYATASENRASGDIDIPLAASVEGSIKAKVIHRREVHGFLAALVTITDPDKAQALGVLGSATAGVQESSLSQTVRDLYDADKLTITDARAATVYTIRDGRGATVTENDFARRYAAVTGSSDLDGYVRFRHPVAAGVGGGLLAVGVGLIGLGAYLEATLPSCGQAACVSQTSQILGGLFSLAGGVGAGAAGGVVLGRSLARPDGGPTEHLLDEAGARLFIQRYNRALLRKRTHEAQQVIRSASTSPISIAPLLSVHGLGVAGQF